MDEKEKKLREKVIEVLRTVYDPEIPVNIYDLGLVYNLEVTEDGKVSIQMTLTSPNCPVAESLPLEVQERVRAIPEVQGLSFELVWDPPFSPEMISDEVKLQLGMI